MRRVVKPFAVEVRNSGRKPKSKASVEPRSLQIDEQPDVVWPEILMGVAQKEAPAKMADRALELQAEPVVEPYRDPRKPPPIRIAGAEDRPPAPEPIVVAAPPVKSAGRILRVIDEAPVVAEPVYDEPVKPAKRAKRVKPVGTVEAPAVEPLVISPPAIDTKAIAATIVLRSGKAKLTRDDFKRGQRWKARLPASVHRAKSRQHTV